MRNDYDKPPVTDGDTVDGRSAPPPRYLRFLSNLRAWVWRFVPRSVLNAMVNFYFNRQKYKKQKFLRLRAFIVSGCNLNCAGCLTFAPIANEYFQDVGEYENDCKRLSFLGGNKVLEFQILGGEPLLHPNLAEILKISRKYFPLAKLKLVTNGILLKKQPDAFWSVCKNCDIEIIITHYPINIGIDKILQISRGYGLNVRYYKEDAPWFKWPYDLDGKGDINKNFKKCQWALQCVTFFHGRISTCSFVYNFRFFREYFGMGVDSTEKDSVDVHKASSIDEILEFIGKPVSLCRFCMGKCVPLEWGQSKKKIDEWT